MIIEVNGIKLFYEKAGTGPPIILLHGNGEDHFIFDEIAKQLAEKFTVYCPDARGHGRSQAAGALHYLDIAYDMVCFIRQLKLERPLFYGFSDGGIVGLLIASRQPELLSRLIVSGANLTPRGMKDSVYWLFRILNVFKRDPKFTMMLTEPDITEEDLSKIRVPVYITAGKRDMIKEDHTRFIAAHIPGSRLWILEGETHGSYVVHSTKLLSMIKEAASERSK